MPSFASLVLLRSSNTAIGDGFDQKNANRFHLMKNRRGVLISVCRYRGYTDGRRVAFAEIVANNLSVLYAIDSAAFALHMAMTK